MDTYTLHLACTIAIQSVLFCTIAYNRPSQHTNTKDKAARQSAEQQNKFLCNSMCWEENRVATVDGRGGVPICSAIPGANNGNTAITTTNNINTAIPGTNNNGNTEYSAIPR